MQWFEFGPRNVSRWQCLARPPYSQHPGPGVPPDLTRPNLCCLLEKGRHVSRRDMVGYLSIFFDMSRCRIRPLLDFYHKIILWDNRRWDVSVFFSFERAPCVTAGIWKCQYRHQTYLLTDWCSCRHGRELFIHWCTWSPDRRCRGVLPEFGMIQLETCTRGSQSRCDMAHCRERAPELCRIKTPWKTCASMEPEVGFGSCIASLNSRTMICRSMHMYAWGCRVWHEGVGLTLKHMAFHWVALKACNLYLIFGFLLFLY